MNLNILKSSINNIIHKYFRELSWVIIGYIVVFIGNIFLVKLLTEYLSPFEYGRLALSLTLSVLVTQVSFSGCASGIRRYYIISLEEKQTYPFILAAKQLFLYGVYIAFFIEFILFVVLFFLGKNYLIWPLAIAVIFQILSALNSLINSVQHALRNRKIVAIHEGLLILVKIGFVYIIFSLLNGSNLNFIFTAYTIAVGIILVSQSFSFNSLFTKMSIDKISIYKWKNKIWTFSKPAMYYNIFSWLQISSDRWAIESFIGTAEVGLYITVLQLGWAPINIITTLSLNFISPIFFQQSGNAMDKDRNAGVNRASWFIIKILIFFFVIYFTLSLFTHEYIYQYLVSEKYRKISYLLPWMILSGGLFSLSQVLVLKIQSDLEPSKLILPKIIIALIGFLFNFVGAYHFGLNGIIGGMICFSMLSFIWYAIINKYDKHNI
jgi:O-antigen/teichoic acid export membrane protein